MPLTGLFLLPAGPTVPSPTPSLLTYLTLQLPAQPLGSSPTGFTLTHHLFASTSSLLPGAAASRQYTSVLTLSHTPALTYVGSTTPGSPPSQVAIPTTAAESFLQILHAKIQPLWTPRQTLLVTDGTALSVELPIGVVHVRVGDMRLSQRQSAQGSALRGVLVEITFPNVDGKVGEKASEQDEGMLLQLLAAIISNSQLDIKAADVKLLTRYTEPAPSIESSEKETDNGSKRKKQSQWALTELYMEMLRSRA